MTRRARVHQRAQARTPVEQASPPRRASVPACSGRPNTPGRSAQARTPVEQASPLAPAGQTLPAVLHKRGRLCYGRSLMLRSVACAAHTACMGALCERQPQRRRALGSLLFRRRVTRVRVFLDARSHSSSVCYSEPVRSTCRPCRRCCTRSITAASRSSRPRAASWGGDLHVASSTRQCCRASWSVPSHPGAERDQ